MAATMEEESEIKVPDDIPEYLNPMSPRFDPMRALYDSHTPVPVPDAKQFNNVAEFENFIKGKDAKTMQKKKTSKKEELPGIIAVRAAAQAKEAVRKAAIMAKSAGPSERSKTQERRNRSTTVFTKMQSYKKGPLSLLKKCVEERLRVVVVVRAAVAVRSRCRGYVIGFDKHFNMALMDVDEKFIRPAPKRKKDVKKETSDRSDSQDTNVGSRFPGSEEGKNMTDLRTKLKDSKLSDRKSSTDRKEKISGRSRNQEMHIRSSDSELSEGERSRSRDRYSTSERDSKQRSGLKDSSRSKTKHDQRKVSSSSDPRKYSSSNEETIKSKSSGDRRHEGLEVKRSKDFKEHYQNYMSDSNLYVKRQQQKLVEKSSKSDSESTSKVETSGKQRKSNPDVKRQFQPFWPLYKKWTESRCYAEYEIITRHVNQLFIRGDNVVSVSIADC